jgi:hypothetical protein
MNRIKEGTEVTWTSQSQGVESEKKGIVIAFIPKHASASDIWESRLDNVKFNPMDIQRFSEFDRYLVGVERLGKKGKPLKPKYYSPIAGVIERQNPGKVPS